MERSEYRKRCYDAFVTKHWQHMSRSSPELYRLKSSFYISAFGRFFPASKQSSILDVGCGPGQFIYALKEEGYENILGIDVSEEQVAMAREAGVKEVEKADFELFLQAHPSQYDLITAMDVIEHLKKEEVLVFLDSIFHALRPGGRVLIVTENAGSMFGAGRVYGDFTHEQGFTAGSLSQVLRVCNFEDVEVSGLRVAHDWRSRVRLGLWSMVVGVMRLLLMLETGTGRGMVKTKPILDHIIFAVGRKP